jgi:hypothetical protein
MYYYFSLISKEIRAMKPITDRIAKAVELIETGKVWKHTDNTFRVLTERFAGGYTVTINTCDCADFETRKDTDPIPCKHQWAAIGATAAMLIDEIRKAESVAALESIGKQYADAMANLPEAFVKIARNEYRAKHCELIAVKTNTNGGKGSANPAKRTVKASVKANVTHIHSSGLMLIKSQPKSSGSYNGIEI